MKKSELIAKLEGAKEVTSVVSIDLVLAALGMLEARSREPTPSNSMRPLSMWLFADGQLVSAAMRSPAMTSPSICVLPL